MYRFTGVVVLESNAHPLDTLPMCFVTPAMGEHREAMKAAQELAFNKLMDGAEKAVDNATKEALENAAYRIRTAHRVEYAFPKTVNYPGGEFVARVMVAETVH